MAEYYFFAKRVGRGSPAFINGLLHERFATELADIPPQYDWYWVEPGQVLKPLPSDLVLIVKDPLINFDLRGGQQARDFYISLDFLKALRAAVAFDAEVATLRILGKDGKERSERGYAYIRFSSNIRLPGDVVNASLSKRDVRRSGEIKKTHSLVLNPQVNRDLFMIDEMSIFRHLFLSEHAADMLRSKIWCGFEIEATTELGRCERA